MSQRPQDKTPQDKFRLVMEAAALTEEELGAFLRREGIHATHLEQWRSEMLGGLCAKPQSKREIRELKKKNKQLEK